MRWLPIGIENFKELIDKEYYYVDKTLFIKDVIKEKVSLFTRPRRFGKTLNMSMLYYFFSVREKDNAYLFDKLAISKVPEALAHQNQYPVIFLSLKDMKRSNYDMQIEKFGSLIADLVNMNAELLSSTALNDAQKNLLMQYQNGTSSIGNLMDALLKISMYLQQHYQKKVILLIDEYDVPLQNAYLNGYYNEMVDFLKNVFSAALKTNDALEKGMLTGCLRIAKETIFTGLNNFNVHSIFDKESSSDFGFTPDETMQLLQKYNLSSYSNIMKEWYDGYMFGNQEIYNPWSVLMYVQKIIQNDDEPESFWANTSGNDLVYRYIQQGDDEMKLDFDLLSTGRMIEKTIKSEVTYREMDDPENIYSFLLFTGYLKTMEKTGNNTYKIMIPNKEIHYIYITIFEEWFKKQIKNSKAAFFKALIEEDVKQANIILNNVLYQSISYYDYDEKYYHGFMVGILQGNGIVSSNQESGLGRFDIAILPRSLIERGLVLELKTSVSLTKLKQTAEKACEQIRNQQYINGLLSEGYEDIIGYGIAFYKKSCVIAKVE